MNQVDITLREAINTIAQQQTRITNLSIENAGFNERLIDMAKEAEELKKIIEELNKKPSRNK